MPVSYSVCAEILHESDIWRAKEKYSGHSEKVAVISGAVLCRYSREERETIREYSKSQLDEDYTKDQMTLKEYIAPFTGRKNDRA